MKLFDSEQQMQKWLSDHFAKGESLAHITINCDDFKDPARSQIDLDAGLQKIFSSFQHCLRSFDNNEVMTENVDISLNAKDVLRPDFVLYAPETESIIIVELKNIKGPTRQAGTEIGAYAAEIRSYLPFFAEGDMINVIISSEWPALVRHYIYNEIVWLNKKLICLEPMETLEGLRLRIIDPSEITDSRIKPNIWSKQLGGYQICLYDEELYSGGQYLRIGQFQDSMLTALHAMSAKGNALKAHGFAFLWRHCFDVGLAPYNITIVNFASFQTPALIFEDGAMGKRIMDIISNYAPEGHGGTLDAIAGHGERFLNGFCTPRPEGFASWDNLKSRVFENTDAIAYVGWGLFQDHFFDRLTAESEHPESGHRYCSTDPLFAIEMLNEMIHDCYPFPDVQ